MVAFVLAFILPFKIPPTAIAATTAPTITAITAGGAHACALTSPGGVKCWGDNSAGQLGNGTTTRSLSAIDVPGLRSGVAAIAAGGSHTCALTTAGGLKCWGRNNYGQLGNATTSDSMIPVDVAGLSAGVRAVAAGSDHTCALTSGGGVKCWGSNFYGELGNNMKADTGVAAPVDVVGLASGVSAISAGAYHACALTVSGGVKCWGYNGNGQLGAGGTIDKEHDPSPAASSAPIEVAGLSGRVSAIAAGAFHNCALIMDGAVECWGATTSGQLGNDSLSDGGEPAPTAVVGLSSGVTAVSAGAAHTCALMSGGGIKCWGSKGTYDQTGTCCSISATPEDVPFITSRARAIAAGGAYTCALTNEVGVKCWGNNIRGQLGNFTTNQSTIPVDVDFAIHQTTILRSSRPAGDIARGTTVALSATIRPVGLAGTVAIVRFGMYRLIGGQWRQTTHRDVIAGATGRATLRWTFPLAGAWSIRAMALGNASYAVSAWSARFRYTVHNVGLVPRIIAIAAGYAHTCAVTSSGRVRCWGDNEYSQLGDGTTTDSHLPVDVAGIAGGAIALAAGVSQSCALMSGGGVKCWGPSLTDVAGLSGVSSIAAGEDHTCALTSGGGVKCWGANYAGQLGNGTTADSLSPVNVSGLASGVFAIAAGGGHSCAITDLGQVKCWGANYRGQLGNDTTTSSSVPVLVTGLANGVTAIALGDRESCAVTSIGRVACWGANEDGQLGNGTRTSSTVPVFVSGLTSRVITVATDGGHACAVTNSGGVKCWGANHWGQLGNGTTTDTLAPVDVARLGSGVVAIAAGVEHTCALMSGGQVKCWGTDGVGRESDRPTTVSTIPVDVNFRFS